MVGGKKTSNITSKGYTTFCTLTVYGNWRTNNEAVSQPTEH